MRWKMCFYRGPGSPQPLCFPSMSMKRDMSGHHAVYSKKETDKSLWFIEPYITNQRLKKREN